MSQTGAALANYIHLNRHMPMGMRSPMSQTGTTLANHSFAGPWNGNSNHRLTGGAHGTRGSGRETGPSWNGNDNHRLTGGADGMRGSGLKAEPWNGNDIHRLADPDRWRLRGLRGFARAGLSTYLDGFLWVLCRTVDEPPHAESRKADNHYMSWLVNQSPQLPLLSNLPGSRT